MALTCPLSSSGLKCVAKCVLVTFISSCLASYLPQPVSAHQTKTTDVFLSPSNQFQFPVLRGIKVDPYNPMRLYFVVDSGSRTTVFPDEMARLIRYFLAGLTVPEHDIWVNLSPYENNRIISDTLSQTDLGRELLEQDYTLKRITSSLTFPDTELGEQFWSEVFARMPQQSRQDIPVNTFNKVWIVPEFADVRQTRDAAFISDSGFDVMLEQDYLAMDKGLSEQRVAPQQYGRQSASKISQITAEVTRELIIPEIKRQVNEGEHFARLRQAYHSLILAIWFKSVLRDHVLNKVYTDRSKIAGIDTQDRDIKQEIYQTYVQAFKKGSYDFVREDYNPATQTVINKKYFSGGVILGQPSTWMNTTQVVLPPVTTDPDSVFSFVNEVLPKQTATGPLNLVPVSLLPGESIDPLGFVPRYPWSPHIAVPFDSSQVSDLSPLIERPDPNTDVIKASTVASAVSKPAVKADMSKQDQPAFVDQPSAKPSKTIWQRLFNKTTARLASVVLVMVTFFSSLMIGFSFGPRNFSPIQQPTGPMITQTINTSSSSAFRYPSPTYQAEYQGYDSVLLAGDALTPQDQRVFDMMAAVLTPEDLAKPEVLDYMSALGVDSSSFEGAKLQALLTPAEYGPEQQVLTFAAQSKLGEATDGLMGPATAGAAWSYHQANAPLDVDAAIRDQQNISPEQYLNDSSMLMQTELTPDQIDVIRSNNNYRELDSWLEPEDRSGILAILNQVPLSAIETPEVFDFMDRMGLNFDEVFRNRDNAEGFFRNSLQYNTVLKTAVEYYQSQNGLTTTVPSVGPTTWTFLANQLQPSSVSNAGQGGQLSYLADLVDQELSSVQNVSRSNFDWNTINRITDAPPHKMTYALHETMDETDLDFMRMIGVFLDYGDLMEHQSVITDYGLSVADFQDPDRIAAILNRTTFTPEHQVLISIAERKAGLASTGQITELTRTQVTEAFLNDLSPQHQRQHYWSDVFSHWAKFKDNATSNLIIPFIAIQMLMLAVERNRTRHSKGNRFLNVVNGLFKAKASSPLRYNNSQIKDREGSAKSLFNGELSNYSAIRLTTKNRPADQDSSTAAEPDKFNLVFHSGSFIKLKFNDTQMLTQRFLGANEKGDLSFLAVKDDGTKVPMTVNKILKPEANALRVRLYGPEGEDLSDAVRIQVDFRYGERRPLRDAVRKTVQRLLLDRHPDAIQDSQTQVESLNIPIDEDSFQYIMNRWNNALNRDRINNKANISLINQALNDLYQRRMDQYFSFFRFRPLTGESRRLLKIANETLAESDLPEDLREVITSLAYENRRGHTLMALAAGIDKAKRAFFPEGDAFNVKVFFGLFSVSDLGRFLLGSVPLVNYYFKKAHSVLDEYYYMRKHSDKLLHAYLAQNVTEFDEQTPLPKFEYHEMHRKLKHFMKTHTDPAPHTVVGNDMSRRQTKLTEGLGLVGAAAFVTATLGVAQMLGILSGLFIPLILPVTIYYYFPLTYPFFLSLTDAFSLRKIKHLQPSFNLNEVERVKPPESHKELFLRRFNQYFFPNFGKTQFNWFRLKPSKFFLSEAKVSDHDQIQVSFTADRNFAQVLQAQLKSSEGSIVDQIRTSIDDGELIVRAGPRGDPRTIISELTPKSIEDIDIQADHNGVSIKFKDPQAMQQEVVYLSLKGRGALEEVITIDLVNELSDEDRLIMELRRFRSNGDPQNVDRVHELLRTAVQYTDTPADIGDFRTTARTSYILREEINLTVKHLIEHKPKDRPDFLQAEIDLFLEIHDLLSSVRSSVASIATMYTIKSAFFSQKDFLNNRFIAPLFRDLFGITYVKNQAKKDTNHEIHTIRKRWSNIHKRAQILLGNSLQKPMTDDAYEQSLHDSSSSAERKYLLPDLYTIAGSDLYERNLKFALMFFSLGWIVFARAELLMVPLVALANKFGFTSFLTSVLSSLGTYVPFFNTISMNIPHKLTLGDATVVLFFVIQWVMPDTQSRFVTARERNRWNIESDELRSLNYNIHDSSTVKALKLKARVFKWANYSSNVLYLLAIIQPLVLFGVFALQTFIQLIEMLMLNRDETVRAKKIEQAVNHKTVLEAPEAERQERAFGSLGRFIMNELAVVASLVSGMGSFIKYLNSIRKSLAYYNPLVTSLDGSDTDANMEAYLRQTSDSQPSQSKHEHSLGILPPLAEQDIVTSVLQEAPETKGGIDFQRISEDILKLKPVSAEDRPFMVPTDIDQPLPGVVIEGMTIMPVPVRHTPVFFMTFFTEAPVPQNRDVAVETSDSKPLILGRR
jgi:hypothetical protein